MPSKARPSLRAKTLKNVERSNLSTTDKECIKAVFERFEDTNYLTWCPPTADVVEEKRGEWIMSKYPLTECTSCHILRDCEHEKGWNYCPRCGAKMDGGTR